MVLSTYFFVHRFQHNKNPTSQLPENHLHGRAGEIGRNFRHSKAIVINALKSQGRLQRYRFEKVNRFNLHYITCFSAQPGTISDKLSFSKLQVLAVSEPRVHNTRRSEIEAAQSDQRKIIREQYLAVCEQHEAKTKLERSVASNDLAYLLSQTVKALSLTFDSFLNILNFSE